MTPARLALGLLLATLPLAAQAQPAPPRHPFPIHRAAPAPPLLKPAPEPPKPLTAEEAALARCRALLRRSLLTASSATVEALDNDGCRYTGARFGISSLVGYEVATLVEHGVPSAMPDKPVSVQIEARGITLAVSTGNTKTDWLSRQQQTPFDVTFDAAYDPAAHTFVLRSLTLDGDVLGHTELALDLAGVDGTTPDDLALRSMRLHVDSKRVLLQLTLPILADALSERDPGAALDAGRAELVAAVRIYLPMTVASAETVDAVAAFVADYPRPLHVLDLDVTASPPLKPSSVIGPTDAALRAALHTVTVTATYAGEPR